MPVKIVHDNYGKSRVRLMKVHRNGDFHDLQNINVKIALEGDFDNIHLDGDNTKCLPTDTMKNTVYALAAQTDEVFQCLKLITRPGCEKIVRFAFEYARRNGRKKVSCFTKDNIMKLTDGLFRQIVISPRLPSVFRHELSEARAKGGDRRQLVLSFRVDHAA